MKFNMDKLRSDINKLIQNHQNREPKIDKDEKAPRIQTMPRDSILLREEDNIILINGIPANIDSYTLISSTLSVKVRFKDGGIELSKVNKSVDDAIRICIARHVGKKYYNAAGIKNLAERLSYLKCVDTMIEKAHQHHLNHMKDCSEEARKSSVDSSEHGIKITRRPHKPSEH